MYRHERQNFPWPNWQIENALAKIAETKKVHQNLAETSTDETLRDKNRSIILALNYAEGVISGINEITPPQPPTMKVTAYKVLGAFLAAISEGMYKIADAIESFNKWDFPDRNYD